MELLDRREDRAISSGDLLRDRMVVPKVGLEPTRDCSHWFLRPARLPFRHFGTVGC